MNTEYRDNTIGLLESYTDDLDRTAESLDEFKEYLRSVYPNINDMKGVVCGVAEFRHKHALSSLFEDDPLKKGEYDFKVNIADIFCDAARDYLLICPK